jgi:hypothetical protein
MGYVLGSETEAMTFTERGIEYVPEGRGHAVDLNTPYNTLTAVLAYAVCSTAVRVWPDAPFDPQASSVHDECVAAVESVSHPGVGVRS